MTGKIVCVLLCMCAVSRTQVIPGKSRTNDGDYNSVNTDGSFDFGYSNKDVGASYHLAHGTPNKVVGGRFGARDPATGTIKETVYTAGPRGFRAKGPNIHRKMDLDQRPRGPIGTKDDPYADPNEDPSYEYKINTRTYSKSEAADARGDVKGHYSYVDDIGERHDVNYIAGRDTGFHVSSAVPDNPSIIGSLFHRSPLVKAERKQRGRTAVQRGLDGSYRFISAGPDQRRSEASDSKGNVRGSYTFLDDKGVQRTVNYIAGPGIGYRIVKNGKDPFIPAYFPTIPSAYDPDFINAAVPPSFSPDDTGSDDIFKGPDGTAASGHVKPPPFLGGDKDTPGMKPGSGTSSEDFGTENEYDSGSSGFGTGSQNSHGFGSAVDVGSYQPDEDASYAGQEYDTKPTKQSGRPPTRPGRPTAKPFGTTNKKPYVPLKPFQTPSIGSSEPAGYPISSSYPSSTGRPSGRPGSRPSGRPGVGSSNRPTESTTNYGVGGVEENIAGTDGDSGPEYAIGFDIHSNKPGSTVIHDKPGTTIIYSKPGTTIIRNIGEDYFGIPPGVSVRAHVQSIDLYPYDSKPLSPSEALEHDKT